MKRPLWLAVTTLVVMTAACSTGEGMPAPSPSVPASATFQLAPTASTSATQNGYPVGFDTYYVATRRSIPSAWGHPGMWSTHAQRDGYQVGATAKPGAIACRNAGARSTVAYVESVSADGTTVTLSAMNYKGNWNKVTIRTEPANLFTYIY